MSRKPAKTETDRRWLIPLALLILSLFLFWVLPGQLPDEPVQVQFESR